MSFPTSPSNGQTTTVNGIPYVYSATKNAWKRSSLSDAVISGNVSVGGLKFADGAPITSGAVYEFDDIWGDGRTSTFQLKYNNGNVSVSSPWNLTVTIDGYPQPAFKQNYDTVWLGHALAASRGYTVNSSGQLKFAESPPPGSLVIVRTAVGGEPTTTKIYPFKPLDIALGL
jgi:hypothetical protein